MTFKDPVEPPGIKNEANLQSALTRQYTGWGTELKYPEIRKNAASLVYGVCMGHGFHNGNKRTALLAGMLHLDRNGYCFNNDITHDDLYNLMKGMAAHNWRLVRAPARLKKRFPNLYMPNSKVVQDADEEVAFTCEWFRENTRIADQKERVLTMRVLCANLSRLGVHFEIKKNCAIVFTRSVSVRFFNLYQNIKTYTLPYQGEGRDVGKNTIKKLRVALELSNEDGVDSKCFYDEGTVIDQMLSAHTRLIKRLGKT